MYSLVTPVAVEVHTMLHLHVLGLELPYEEYFLPFISGIFSLLSANESSVPRAE